jgi:heme exporter protein D
MNLLTVLADNDGWSMHGFASFLIWLIIILALVAVVIFIVRSVTRR